MFGGDDEMSANAFHTGLINASAVNVSAVKSRHRRASILHVEIVRARRTHALLTAHGVGEHNEIRPDDGERDVQRPQNCPFVHELAG